MAKTPKTKSWSVPANLPLAKTNRGRVLARNSTTCSLLLCLLCGLYLPAQTRSTYDMGHLKAFQKQLMRDQIYNWVSGSAADGLLIEKADPIVKASSTHRMGTVVVAFEIAKSGEIQHATVMSGPKELQKPVLKAVEQYKYKPYLFNGTPSAVATTVSVTVYNY